MSDIDKYKPTIGETTEMAELEELVRAQNKARAKGKAKQGDDKDRKAP